MPFDNDKRVSCFNPKLANLKNLKQKGGVKKGDGIEGGCINNFRREVFMKRFLKLWSIFCISLLVGIFSERNLAWATSYTITDLGTLSGGTESYAYGINDSGQVVGGATIGAGYYHAFLYSGGVMQDIGTLPSENYSNAYGINNSGQVIGNSSPDANYWHAFLYSGGVMQDLGTLGGNESSASGINDYGQVVGGSLITGNSANHAFFYNGGVMTDLGTLPGGLGSFANDINDSGQVVGSSTTSSGYGLPSFTVEV